METLYFPVHGVNAGDLYDCPNKKIVENESITSDKKCEDSSLNINEQKISLILQEEKTSADQLEWMCQMSEKQTKPKATTVKNSKGRLVEVNGEKIALFRHGEKVYAVNERCPHQGGPLHLGDIEELPCGDLCVKCPWHGWCIKLGTGQVISPKRTDLAAKVYPVKTDQKGNISIAFQSINSKFFSSTDF